MTAEAVAEVASKGVCFLGHPFTLKTTPEPEVDCEALDLVTRQKPRILIDGFLINNENAAVVTRVLEIGNTADHLIMIESEVTFTDRPRNTTFPVLQPCTDGIMGADGMPMTTRILHGVIPGRSFHGNRQAWSREKFLRNSIVTAAAELIERLMKENPSLVKDDFLLAISDADEIPRPSTYAILKRCKGWREPSASSLAFFYYNFRWRKTYEWGNGPRVFPWPMVEPGGPNQYLTGQDARERVGLSPEEFIRDGGWHLAYFLPPSEIALKLRSFAHTEFNRPPFNTPEWIDKCINTGQDLFNRAEHERTVEQNCRDLEYAEMPSAVKRNEVLLRYFCPTAE